jgi:predicted nucleotidyltransferase
MNEMIIQNLKALKEKYLPEGFIIIGVFGSFAKDTEMEKSDIDILYELNERFLSANSGFDAYVKLDKIRLEIQRKLCRKIDMVNKNSLRRTGKKFILPETFYV